MAIGRFAAVTAGLLLGAGASAQETADPRANRKAVKLLEFLKGLPRRQEKRAVCGQLIGPVDKGAKRARQGYEDYIRKLAEETGRWPGLIGADYFTCDDPEGIAQVNQILIEYARRGGLVTISMHPANPWTGGNANDRRLGDYRELLRRGTEANRRWLRMLDTAAAGLAEFQRAGIPVLWRPLHEINGYWFWWTPAFDKPGGARDEIVALWKHMFEYFTREKKLHNLLWVYAPNAHLEPKSRATDFYYPGDAFVDVVALDYYGTEFDRIDQNEGYRKLRAFGKPIALAEYGPTQSSEAPSDNLGLLRALKEKYPEVCYFMYWRSWGKVKVAIRDNRNARELLSDPWVVTLEDLKRPVWE